jgi:sialic acid synthase SpsE
MHLGDLNKAKELIRVAKECGADAVKGQAFAANDMIQAGGSMTPKFYEKCELNYFELLELIDYGKGLDIDVFFTVISRKFTRLHKFQKYRKIWASRFASYSIDSLNRFDGPNTIISTKDIRRSFRSSKKSNILYATDYNEDIEVHKYQAMKNFYNRPIGVSHHYHCIGELLRLCSNYEVPMIEKHFFLGDMIMFDGRPYRDCVHAANPRLFEKLSKKYKG